MDAMKIGTRSKDAGEGPARIDSVGAAMIALNIKETAQREGYDNPNSLASAAGLPYETCRKLWNGLATRIDLGTIERLCNLLRVRPGQLFDYEYEPDRPKRKPAKRTK